MALPDIISKISQKEDKEKREYLLAIEIWDGEVKSAIWTVEGGKTRVAALGSHERWAEKEELIEAADRSLSQASERFTETGKEPSKVIFGLPEKWTDNKEIKPEYQKLLRELYQKLELKPVGYVLTFDALIHHLKRVEGIPPSAILVKLLEDKIHLAIVEVGKKLGAEEVSRSQNLASDLGEGLVRISEAETLPARLLVFDSDEIEKVNQELVAYPWLKPQPGGKKLPFLHLPKIEILPTDSDINAVALAGGSEVAKSLGFEIKEEIKETPVVEEPEVKEEPQAAEDGEEKAVEPEVDFGFVRGKDIKEEEPEKIEPKEIEPEVEEETTSGPPSVDGLSAEISTKREMEEETTPSQEGFGLVASIFSVFKKLPKLSRLRSLLPSIRLPFTPGWPFFTALIGGGILVLGGLFLALLWFLPRAEVVVFIKPKVLEEELKLTIDPNQEVIDQENHILPGRILQTEESGEKSAPTTGEKTVGERAKGEVTVYNRTDLSKTFEAGTVITDSGLQFALDEEVNVASKTPDLNTGVDKWGEVKVGATAGEIGAQYNLAAGTQFSVADYSFTSFLAKNESDFSGGTSRKIQVVSEEDREDLLTGLSDELADRAEGKLLSEVPLNLSLIEESILTEPKSQNFSHEENEETQTLSLKLIVEIKALAFNREEFVKLIEPTISDSIPEGYRLKEDEVQSKFEIEEENEDGSILFKTQVKANLLPKLEPEEIAKDIKSKYPHLAEDYLRTIPGFVRVETNIYPRLPGFLATLPRRENRIKVEIRSQ